MNTLPLPDRRVGLVLLAGLAALSVWMSWAPGLHVADGHTTPQEVPRPATQVTPLSCEPLADVPGKVVTTLRVDFPPHGFTPAHRHPGAVTAFVVHGAVRSQMQGLPAHTYTAGQTWFEPTGELHLFAENSSATEPAQLLAVIVSDEGCGALVIPEPHH